jgi:RNA polymerase sigma-70 factor (ECF subfamily)
MTSREQENWWVLRAQSGDRQALDRLLRAVQEPLYRYILSLNGGDHHGGEDVLQEVFVRIFRKIRCLREPTLFRPWMYRMATRETLRHLQRDKRWTEQVRDEALLDAVPSPAAAEIREQIAPEIRERLPELVAGISPASRAVVVLFYLHEMPLAEVAATLDIPLGTAKSRLAYGLTKLRQQKGWEQETQCL